MSVLDVDPQLPAWIERLGSPSGIWSLPEVLRSSAEINLSIGPWSREG